MVPNRPTQIVSRPINSDPARTDAISEQPVRGIRRGSVTGEAEDNNQSNGV
jgi:hypothetical protein